MSPGPGRAVRLGQFGGQPQRAAESSQIANSPPCHGYPTQRLPRVRPLGSEGERSIGMKQEMGVIGCF